jgi:ABC-type dipeptide/oligopeptide/nickel transport system permease subunit
LTDVKKFIKSEPTTSVALLVLLVYVLIAIFAPYIATHDPMAVKTSRQVNGEKQYAPFPPSSEHWFGTDQLGRDIFSRVVYGVRVSIIVGIIARGLSMLLGVTLGLISGYYGGVVDNVIMRITDVFFSFPAILLAMMVTMVLGSGLWTVCLAIMLVGWPDVARLVRSQVLSVRNKEYVTAIKALGGSTSRIMVKHILRNCLGIIVVAFSMGIPGAVMYEAGLSFFGLGLRPPIPSLGSIIADGRGYIIFAPWYSLFPGLALAIFVLCCNVVGDTLVDVLDPSYRNKGR